MRRTLRLKSTSHCKGSVIRRRGNPPRRKKLGSRLTRLKLSSKERNFGFTLADKDSDVDINCIIVRHFHGN